MELIRDFKDLGKGDAALAGGKGASLGEMTQAGIPVPPGFVVLAGTFERFIEEAGLANKIEEALAVVDPAAMATVDLASTKIQDLILTAQMPGDIAADIHKHWKELGAEHVAVRSSATAEDSASAAWAGQLDSYLNTTEAELLRNVQRCWASLFTPRAIFYRFEKELHLTHISVAVVVQKMIHSEVSGIAFSVHPVTEDRNQLIIEAGFGLGEAIVSGQITPDSYVVEKSPRKIVETSISTQTRGLYRAALGGNEWKVIAEPQASSQALETQEIHDLSDIILRIEKHYGFPCDIEWAYEGGTFYIVQSRPITTLTPLVDHLPLSFLKPEDFNYVGLYKCSPFSLWYWSAWYAKDLADELGVPHEPDIYFGFKGGHTFARKTSEEQFRVTIKERVEAGDVAYFKALSAALEREAAKAEEFGRTLVGLDLTAAQFDQLVSFGRRLLFFCFVAWQNSQQFDALFKTAAEAAGILEDRLGEYIPAPQTLLTAQHDDALELKALLEKKGIWELLKQDAPKAVQAIQTDSALWPRFEAHLKKFKWLNLMNWIGDGLSLEKLLEQMSLVQPTRHAEAPEAPSGFKKYVDIAAEIAYLRNAGVEHLSIYTQEVMEPLERLAKHMDISYRDLLLLIPTEVFEGSSIAPGYIEKIARRQNENWCVYGDPATGVLTIEDDAAAVDSVAARFLPTQEIGNDGALTGQIGNKGKARGPARIILATDDFHKMRPGDILVTPMTTPDFVLLMQKSAAIVTDMGGLLCHAAIVSRELNKPCVIDTKFATQILNDGDLVEVDADQGVVRILEKAAPASAPDFLSDLYRKDFVLTFESVGTDFLFENLACDYYMQWEMVACWKDKRVQAFSRKEALDGLAQEGLGRSAKDTRAVMASLDALVAEAYAGADRFKKEGSITLEGMQAAFALARDIFKGYAYFDAAYWDSLYARAADDAEARETIELVQEYKNAVREKLNVLFFDEDSYLVELVRAIGRQGKIEPREAQWYLISELPGLLEGKKVPQEELEARHATFIFYKDAALLTHMVSGRAADAFIASFAALPDQGSVIKGKAASGKGVVRARARVITRDYSNVAAMNEEMARMEPGEVLVSETTDPAMMPALKKASAVVTDIGGMLSHAAISARELGILCVVETEDASKRIKTGDMLEVNADTGTVQKV